MQIVSLFVNAVGYNNKHISTIAAASCTVCGLQLCGGYCKFAAKPAAITFSNQ